MSFEYNSEKFKLIQKTQNKKFNLKDNIVLITFNDGYKNQAINLMMSVKRYNANVSFICLCNRLLDENVTELMNLQDNDMGVLLYQFDMNINWQHTRWVPITILRVFSPWLIDENIDEVLYLDADIICQGNLDDLFNFKNYLICMAADVCTNRNNGNILNGLKTYCNAGVCKLNFSRLRNEYHFNTLDNAFFNNLENFPLLDQDFLNLFFQDKITVINNEIYNFQPYEYWKSFYYWHILNSAKLIHFTIGKPWDRVTPLYLFEIYLKNTFYKPMKDIVQHEYKRRKQLNFFYWLKRKIKKTNVDS